MSGEQPHEGTFMENRLMGSRVIPAARMVRLGDLPWRTEPATGSKYWSVALSLAQLTYFEVPAGARFERHSHRSEQITLVLDGLLVFEVDGQQHTVGAGEVIAIPGDAPHAVVGGPAGARAVDAWSPPQWAYEDAET